MSGFKFESPFRVEEKYLRRPIPKGKVCEVVVEKAERTTSKKDPNKKGFYLVYRVLSGCFSKRRLIFDYFWLGGVSSSCREATLNRINNLGSKIGLKKINSIDDFVGSKFQVKVDVDENYYNRVDRYLPLD